jgi:tRNA G18 (ribose-2'-O)-methylase SpoU
MRGFFEIGIYHGKTVANVGTLWRSAYQLGASGIFTVGQRYSRQASDTVKAYKHVPLRTYLNFDALISGLPYSCPIVAVEMGGRSLPSFFHPERAVYLLGAEDSGIPASVLARCHHVVSLPSINTNSYNVAVAGSIVMFDRQAKAGAFQK